MNQADLLREAREGSQGHELLTRMQSCAEARGAQEARKVLGAGVREQRGEGGRGGWEDRGAHQVGSEGAQRRMDFISVHDGKLLLPLPKGDHANTCLAGRP